MPISNNQEYIHSPSQVLEDILDSHPMTLTCVQLVSAHDTSGLVHYIAYMIDPIAEAYGIILICVLSSCVFWTHGLREGDPTRHESASSPGLIHAKPL